MRVIIVNTISEIAAFNIGITPLMLAANQLMERWADEAQSPHNAITNQYAILTDCTGTRREVMQQYLNDNGLTEVELDPADEDWFPPMPEMFNMPTP